MVALAGIFTSAGTPTTSFMYTHLWKVDGDIHEDKLTEAVYRHLMWLKVPLGQRHLNISLQQFLEMEQLHIFL